ncbi:MAG: hypothetical protein IKL68_00460 [Clostridia bacterium]|nr:hypothetical protein [Clostridia bacterium]
MENSAYEAVIIGVNTIVFMVAVSVGMLLMTTINQMIDYTREIADSEIGGNLIKEYGEQQERTFTGAEVYALYGQALKGELDDYTIRVNASGSNTEIKTYGSSLGIAHLNSTFVLKHSGANTYTFVIKND